jgi:hypothetical protein
MSSEETRMHYPPIRQVTRGDGHTGTETAATFHVQAAYQMPMTHDFLADQWAYKLRQEGGEAAHTVEKVQISRWDDGWISGMFAYRITGWAWPTRLPAPVAPSAPDLTP